MHITKNQLVDYTRKYYQNVVVDSGATLTVTCLVEMVPYAKIIVRPGGKLVLDGGTLTSACPGEMWQGIEVVGDRTKKQLAQYQGKVELKNGAVIENALCGIYTGLHGDATYATAGGIISATNSSFHNNRRAVEINSYSFTPVSGSVSNYNSTFTNCTFSVDANNLFSGNNTAFAEHVRLWDVKGVKIHGCTFTNTTSDPIDRGRGIYAEDAGLVLDEQCSPDYIVGPDDCGCPPMYADTCEFSGFTTAVEVNTTGNPYSVEASRVLFENNVTGLQINGNNYATVTECDFNLQTVPGLFANNKGLVLIGCTGYKVEGNMFRRNTYIPQQLVSTGILAEDNGKYSNNLHLNRFVNQNYGIYASLCNGSIRSGLQFTCNTFLGCGIDFYVASGATVAPFIGTLSAGADNNFQNTRTSSLYNAGNQVIGYCYSVGTDHVPYNPTNIYVSTANTANPCTSTLCDHSGPQPFSLTGFQSGMSAYTSAEENALADGTDGGTEETQNLASLQTMRQTLSDTYYAAVREIMSDTVLDLNELEQWHTAAQPIGDPYSLTETRFMLGYSEPFTADAEDAEMANYAEFHALKLALVNDNADNDNNDNNDNADNQDNNNSQNSQNSQNSPMINWYSLTESQIAQLQTIAERKTGRASVMAKGVLCFFHGICYEDEWDDAGVFDTPATGWRHHGYPCETHRHEHRQ